MSTSNTAIPYTYEDYKTLTASTDQRYELIDGNLYMTPSPSVTHQAVSMNLALLLARHVRETGSGRVLSAPLDVVLGDAEQCSVVQPDILYISNERDGIITDAEIVGAPDLIVEILWPGTANRDQGVKKSLYARSGVREYWIVDAALEQIEIFLLSARNYGRPTRFAHEAVLSCDVLPGFEAPLSEIFRLT